jgi:hypothetical protein
MLLFITLSGFTVSKQFVGCDDAKGSQQYGASSIGVPHFNPAYEL